MEDVIKLLLSPFKIIWRITVVASDITAWIIDKIREEWRKKPTEKPLGDSDWATPQELKEAGRLEPVGWLVGVTDTGEKVFTDHESSLVLVAQKGLGKSLSIEAHLRNLWRRDKKRDVIMYDPKGGVINRRMEALEQMGYQVCVIDLTRPDSTLARYNPLSILRVDEPYDIGNQIKSLVNLLCPMSQVGHRNEHFESYPQIMMRGMLKYKLTKYGDKATLYDCVTTLLDGELREKAFKEMHQMKNDPQVKGAVEVWNSVSDREKGSFISSNFRKLEYWISPTVRRITTPKQGEEKSIGWTWEDMFRDEKPIFLGIITDLQAEDGELVRLIIGNAINSAKRYYRERGKLPKGLDIIIDEANTLGPCSALVDTNRTLREAGVNTFQCWLSFQDLLNLYPDAQTMLDGSDVIAYGNSGDYGYYDYVSKRLRHTTVMASGESESDHTKGKNRHEHRKRLLEPDDFGAIPFGQCVASLRSKQGFLNFRGSTAWHIENNDVVFK